MKKILVLLLVVVFNFGVVSADYEKKVESIQFDYSKARDLYLKTEKAVNKYYYDIVFEKGNKDLDYKDLQKKFEEYNKYIIKVDRYLYDIKIDDVLSNPDVQEIVNTLGYHTMNHYERYTSISNKSFLFEKEYNFKEIRDLKLNNKIDGIYLGLKFTKISKEKKYSQIESESNIRKIYTKFDNKKGVGFKKIDLEKFDGKIKIDIEKFIKEIDKNNLYVVALNFYIKKGDNYIALFKNNIRAKFYFDNYSIREALNTRYRMETNPNSGYYYRDSSVDEDLKKSLNEKLKVIFDKIKSKKTNAEYLSFLENVKSKIIKFTSDREKYDRLIEEVKDKKSFEKAYLKFKKYRNQEKIINILQVFISNEIYENTLEDTISDFIK